jgi:hypothetical protein
LFLHNVGQEFPADWVKRSAEAAHSKAEVRTAAASDEELLKWIAAAVNSAQTFSGTTNGAR